ncbi:MEKHLA domain-containing protein [Rhizobium laguerreae]|uniref:MEKHLA domain-containing protein n=1 Tax=Rhizobium laguerreae TaxID=1076926 RepID=UPI001C91EAE1|nr:MEKHLA domain-containing protein [Rhizobium laguerreae]MBY3297796.1 MEKHLA domain-containing protein [Rhizobium laguerreae]MBY3310907.1 MEKHLA domain-containing protein [Rhizobium laguerreae]MBY3324029.1 MEKHLA domain-containing protein [Rhizobium laguerreae]MBY3540117.1 MEKHLA domain-containing protein [Rhizobium laguerreae]MBY3547747.1 MEKHLA domain-containing protein [Rhizobium laguerreae]
MRADDIKNPNDPEFFDLLTGSFKRLLGRPLVEKERGPEWLYGDAPFVVLAHNTDADPVFVYGNVAAQKLFGYSWSEIRTLKSRLSAGPAERDERQRLLDAVSTKGFIKNYRGLRVTKSGGRFWMEDGIVWQLRDDEGGDYGQAAMFSKWTEV